MPFKDKEVQRRYHRQRAEQHLNKISEYLKEHPCYICGESDLDVLDFHHVNPNEKVSPVKQAYRSWEYIQREMNKCVVLCANCHRRVHAMMKLFSVS